MFNHPIPDYSIYFRILTAQSGWNDTTLRGVFSQGLPDDLKEELAMREVSGNLEALIILVTRLKNRLQERRRQRESEKFTECLQAEGIPPWTPQPLSPFQLLMFLPVNR